MFEYNSYQAHDVHNDFYEALHKLLELDYSNQRLADQKEARKKRRKRRDVPRTPPGSPPSQPPPPPAGASSALGNKASSLSKTATSASQSMAWTTSDTRYESAGVFGNHELSPTDYLMQDDSIPEEHVLLSDDEDFENDHQPKADVRKDWWKPLPEEERLATPEPAWTIPFSNKSDVANNWASALATTYEPLAENSLLTKIGDIATFLKWYCRQVNKTTLIQADFERQAYEVVKAFYPDVIHLQFQMEECQKMLTAQVDWTNPEGDHVRIDVNQLLPLGGPPEHTIAKKDFKNLYPSDFEDLNLLLLQGHLDHLPGSDKRMLSTAVKLWTRNLVIRQRVKDFQLGIESYQTQLNLTKPGWDTTSYKFKHDYTIIQSPRAVVFPVNNNERKIMRFNKIYKFGDRTLTRILKALDYRVKEFKVKRLNPGMNTRFWTEKDVTRSKEFIAAIERRLKTRRIYRNLGKIFCWWDPLFFIFSWILIQEPFL
ncbi:hypothetical protein Tco_0572432 [Tanacetum coccineum]